MKQGIIKKLVSIIAILAGLFHIYAGLSGIIITQKIISLTLMMIIVFLTIPFKKNRQGRESICLIDIFFTLISLVVGSYLIVNYVKLIYSIGLPNTTQTILGLITIILVLELTRRTMGWPLVIISVLFIIYGLFGEFLPGILKVKSFGLDRVVMYLYLTNDGIFGPAMSATARFVILFVIMGAFLRLSGIGEYFIKVATNIFGGSEGGPAKIAIVASSLYGTVSGSSTANVVTTGSFTIPLMKKSGYSADFAGAVEAVSSCGGQFMPPIMGSVAFILAEIVGISYIYVMKAATIPAVLYYCAIFFMVDFRAKKLGLKLKKTAINWKYILSGSYKIFPIILLIYLLIGLHYSLMRSAIITVGAIIILSWFDKNNKMGWKKIGRALQEGIYGARIVVSASACAGIVIGIVNLTGLGLRLSSIIVEISHANLLFTLILAMISCIILGMGVPTLAGYLIMSVVVVPAIIQLGVDRLLAHLFVMYFAIFSSITPPVALASYAAAAISGGSVWQTGKNAFRLGITGFLVPYLFVYNPKIAMIGSFWEVIYSFIIALMAVYCLSAVLEKYFFRKRLNNIMQIFLLLVTFSLVYQNGIINLIGIFIFMSLWVINFFKFKVKI